MTDGNDFFPPIQVDALDRDGRPSTIASNGTDLPIGELAPAMPATYCTTMPRKVVITGPAPSLEETAREVGLSPGVKDDGQHGRL